MTAASMTSRKEAAEQTPTLVVGDSADAGEDGDFVALRESRECRVPETLDLSTIEFLSECLQHPADQRSHVSRPTSSRLRKKTVASGDTLWTDLTEAAESGPAVFLQTLNRVTSQVDIHNTRLQHPVNKQNILHHILELNDPDLLRVVLDKASQELILHTFDVNIMNISGKMTAFHQVVQRNNLAVLKILLDKISESHRVVILSVETPMEIKGQRPRTFPCLHLAAYYGFTSLVEHILDLDVDVNHLNAKKDTALLWGARWNHVQTLRLLLSRGAEADLENDKGSTALYWAVRYDHSESVVLLASEGKADVNKQRKLGLVAPVVLASALGFTKTLNILLKCGADPNTAIRGNERAIHHAAKEGFSDIVELLVEYGADVDAADVRGDTALLLAAKYGAAKAVQTLLKHGARLDHRNVLGENVWKFAIASHNDLILKLLVVHQMSQAADRHTENGPDLNMSADGINSLLFLAAAVGNVSMMALLFQIKVSGSATDEHGNTFLHIAAVNNQPLVIEDFHKMVNIDSINTDGNTALHEACIRGHHDVIVKLINVKAMANIRNAKGETSLHVAAKCKSIQPSTVSLLMDFVIKTHSWECLNMSDNFNNNALHIAARHARPDVLWEFRFVSLKAQDNDGNTALHNVVRPGEADVLGIMLDIFEVMKRDCDINHKNKMGETPLLLAAREGFIQGVQRLMLFGADISLLNNEGNSVLHTLTSLTVTRPERCGHFLAVIQVVLNRAPLWYCLRQSRKITEHDQDSQFVKRRAILKLTTEIANNCGLTVLDLACQVGACEVIKLLVSMENVMAFKIGQMTRYDVTNIIPRTIGSPSKKVVPRTSCLTWLLVSGRTLPQNASKVLDIQPFRDIEAAYGAVANWSYAILMALHILYMSLFSWSGLALLNDSRLRPGDRSVSNSALVTYIVVPLEPLIIFLYTIYRLIKYCCWSGDVPNRNKLSQTTHMLKTSLAVLITLVYSLFVVMWIIMYIADFRFMDIFLSIALCLGWMLSIAFTRGFKVINYFWRLIQIMIVRDVFKFLVIYLFILLAFSFAFHAQFEVSQDIVNLYPNPVNTIFLMFNMMIGMEYVFEGDVVSNGLQAGSRNDVFIKVLYILYMILATIVLLNILIAMMNDSYQEILQRQQLTWRIESVALGVDVEQTLPTTFPLFSKVKVTHGHICPSDELYGILRWYIEVDNIQDGPALEVSTSPDNKDVSELQAKMVATEARMSQQIQSIKSTMDDMNVLLRSLEQSLTSQK